MAKIWTYLKQSNFFMFELFAFFRLFAWMVSTSAIGLLTQDKICLITYNQSASFCQNIQNDWNTTAEQEMRDQVLAANARFANYKSMLEFIPMLTWALFVGSFLDQTVNGVFVVMTLQSVSGLISSATSLLQYYLYYANPYYMLSNSLSMCVSGGMVSFVTTAYRYLTVRTPEETRSLKFLLLEVIIVIGMGVSIFVGGQLVGVTNLATTDRLRTYHYNFYLSLALDLVGLVFIFLLFIRDKAVEVDQTIGSKSIWRRMFDVDNVRQTVQCVLKKRPNNVRMQIFMLYFALFTSIMVTNGVSQVMTSFALKVYHWSPTVAITWSAISQIASMVLLGIASPLLIKWLKVRDSILIIISQVSSLLHDAIIGTILHQAAYYISIPIGSLAWLGMTAIRTKMSKIIPADEIGKIFSFSSTIDALVPFVASLVYNNLFSVSISSYPGAIYHLGVVLMALAVVVMIFEMYYCPVQSNQQNVDEPKNVENGQVRN